MIRVDLPTDPYLTFPSPEPYLLEGRMRIIVQLFEDGRGVGWLRITSSA